MKKTHLPKTKKPNTFPSLGFVENTFEKSMRPKSNSTNFLFYIGVQKMILQK